MRNILKQWLTKKPQQNANKQAKKEQLKHAVILLLIAGASYVAYAYSAHTKEPQPKVADLSFDGVFDEVFNQASDEALIEKQQHQIDKLTNLVTSTEAQAKSREALAPDMETKALVLEMQEKLAKVIDANKKINEQLQVALLTSQQARISVAQPPTREEMEAKRLQHQHDLHARFSHAGLETVHFNHRHKKKEETRTARNYVWAGTFAEGVLLTGILGDAGINGSKNMGTALIRLTTGGIMPNEQHSHLESCVALVSTYGDLSASSVVLHLETLSCAGNVVNFEQRVYGSVFDLDAMQDLRGTSVLKTKPLLSYTAAAGVLAGIGDGLRSYGSVQAVNSNGSYTTISPGALAQSAAGGGISNPANRISDYVMKIADIYHPLVVARAGRRVSVLFTKGFWIDKEHQVYESGKAIDERDVQQRAAVTTTISQEHEFEQRVSIEGDRQAPTNAINTPSANSTNAEQDFMQQQTQASMPLFSTIQQQGNSHG
jgi:conjugal transfer pilus assembly protein TraB